MTPTLWFALAYAVSALFVGGAIGCNKKKGERDIDDSLWLGFIRPLLLAIIILCVVIGGPIMLGGWIRYNLFWKTDEEKAREKLSKKDIQPNMTGGKNRKYNNTVSRKG